MQLKQLNTVSEAEFLALIGGPLEGETWLAERIASARPFADETALMQQVRHVIHDASDAEKVRLIASHPELAPSVETDLSETSQREQAAAGLNQLTPDEYATFQRLNTAYNDKFGFPFVICARDHTKASILAAFEERLSNTRAQEIATGTAEIIKIIRYRLHDLLATPE